VNKVIDFFFSLFRDIFVERGPSRRRMSERTEPAAGVQVYISPTFFARLFCTKVLLAAFLYLHFRFEIFGKKNIGANALIKCW
jgi:hypothetical protein